MKTYIEHLAYRWHLESKGKCLELLFIGKTTLAFVCICSVYSERFTPTCSLVHTGHNVHRRLQYVKARQGSARA